MIWSGRSTGYIQDVSPSPSIHDGVKTLHRKCEGSACNSYGDGINSLLFHMPESSSYYDVFFSASLSCYKPNYICTYNQKIHLEAWTLTQIQIGMKSLSGWIFKLCTFFVLTFLDIFRCLNHILGEGLLSRFSLVCSIVLVQFWSVFGALTV